jgi:ferredoxin
MKEKILSRANCDRFIQRLREKGYQVFGPREAEGLVLFQEIQSASDLAPGYSNSARSIKEFFLPAQEPLLSYGVSKEGIRTGASDQKPVPTVLFGVRPCDAAYLPIIDQVFSWDEKDELYLARRENTLVICLACEEPDEACFCTSLGYSPAGKEGCDVLLTPVGGDRFFVEFASEKGEQLLTDFPDLWMDASPADRARREEVEAGAKGKIQRKVEMEGIKEWLDDHFEDPLWEEISQRCVGCAACYYLCPTCHCFDIVDEGDLWRGTRRRIWDTCSFGHFTQMPAHQPRESQHRRYRQRIMHKLKYYVDRFGLVACVGCGRCLKVCPVGIDLPEILGQIRERATSSLKE